MESSSLIVACIISQELKFSSNFNPRTCARRRAFRFKGTAPDIEPSDRTEQNAGRPGFHNELCLVLNMRLEQTVNEDAHDDCRSIQMVIVSFSPHGWAVTCLTVDSQRPGLLEDDLA